MHLETELSCLIFFKMAHKINYLLDQSKQEVKAKNIASQLFCQNAQIVNQTKEIGM